MTRLQLLIANALHYWRTNLAVLLGVAAATAVISGALIVGDFVRASVRQMSLDRLGQKDAACASYSELNSKFPDAPQSVKARAQAERQRVGCQ